MKSIEEKLLVFVVLVLFSCSNNNEKQLERLEKQITSNIPMVMNLNWKSNKPLILDELNSWGSENKMLDGDIHIKLEIFNIDTTFYNKASALLFENELIYELIKKIDSKTYKFNTVEPYYVKFQKLNNGEYETYYKIYNIVRDSMMASTIELKDSEIVLNKEYLFEDNCYFSYVKLNRSLIDSNHLKGVYQLGTYGEIHEFDLQKIKKLD